MANNERTSAGAAGSAPAAAPFNPDPLAAKVPLWLPMGFTITGLLSGLVLLVGLTAFWGDFTFIRLQPRLLANVHLFTLGFGSAITIGVLYQMAPVVLVTKLHSPSVGWASMATFVPGMAILVASFYTLHIPGLVVGAAVTVAGAVLFVYNMGRTWRAAPEDSLTRWFLLPSVTSFMLALLVGFTIAATWRFGWRLGPRGLDLLSAHLFLGVGGWFTGIIIGVSYRLVPMFRLVHGHDETFGHTILRLLYIGVALGAVAPFMGLADGLRPLTPSLTGIGLLLVLAAVGGYGWDFQRLWRRSLRAADVWMAQVPWAVGYMLVAAAVALIAFLVGLFGVAVSPGVVLAIGTLFALGFVGTMILSLLHKIVPFLVWYHRYMSQIGKMKVPLMKDLVDEGRGRIGFMMYHGALVMAVIAMAADIAQAVQGAFALLALAFLVLMSDVVQLLVPEPAQQEAIADVETG